MLQIIRNVFTGWIAVLFIVLLIIPFAFWGIDSYFGGSANVDAAQVNDVQISLAEYQQSFQNVRRQLQNISPDLAEQNDFIKQQTLDKLIDRILLLEVNEDLSLRVSDNQVRTAILAIPSFNNPEGFSTVTYQNFLLSSGYTPATFENEMRQDMSLEQLQAGIIGTTIVTPEEINRIVRIEKQTRDIQYATIKYDRFRDGVEVSEEEIQAYYDEHTSDFTSPEQVKLAYINLSIDRVAEEVETTEEEIRAYFENYRDNYSVTERRKVRQLLVYAEDEADREQASSIAAQIYDLVTTSSTSFADAQNQFDSEEVTIEVSDFGFLNQGVLDEEVDEVVFSADVGVVSQPISTEYGFQLMLVDEVTGGDRPSFEQVQGEVETDYRREQAEKRFFELYDELAVLTYEHPETLELASESLGLPLRESGLLSRFGGSDMLLNNQKVISAAFSNEVLLDGVNSELIELDSDDIVVLRVLEHQPQKILPLTDVKDTIEARLLFEKGSEMTRAMGEEIIAKLEQGAEPDSLTEEYSIIWAGRNNVARNGTDLDSQMLEAAFKAGAPRDGKAALSGTQLLRGDYAIIIVNEVHQVDLASLSETEILPIKNRLLQNRASVSWSSIIGDLRSNADINIYDDNIN